MKVAAGAWWMVALSMAAALALAGCGGDESTDEGSESETDEDTGGSVRPDGDGEPDDEDAGTTPGEDATGGPDEDTTGGTDSSTGIDITPPPADVSVPDTTTESPGDRALEPCGGANGDCVAGLDCLNTGSDGEGFCVLPCDGAACDDVRGEPAICALGVQGEPEPRYCVPLCRSDADCPAGIACKAVNETISVCSP